MKREMLILPLAIMLTVTTLSAQELQNVFLPFLAKLTERNEELKPVKMPDVEMLTAPDFEGDALYMAVFKTSEDGRLFYTVLEKEDIPCLTFPNDDKRIGLFHTDLLKFLMKTAVGL